MANINDGLSMGAKAANANQNNAAAFKGAKASAKLGAQSNASKSKKSSGAQFRKPSGIKDGQRIASEYDAIQGKLNSFQTKVYKSGTKETHKTMNRIDENSFEVLTRTQDAKTGKVSNRHETYTKVGGKIVKKSVDNMDQSNTKVVKMAENGEHRVTDEKKLQNSVKINKKANETLEYKTSGKATVRRELDPNRYGDKVDEVLNQVKDAESKNLARIPDPDNPKIAGKPNVQYQHNTSKNGQERVVLTKRNEKAGIERVQTLIKTPNPNKSGEFNYKVSVEERDIKTGKKVYTKTVETYRTDEPYGKDSFVEVPHDSRFKR